MLILLIPFASAFASPMLVDLGGRMEVAVCRRGFSDKAHEKLQESIARLKSAAVNTESAEGLVIRGGAVPPR